MASIQLKTMELSSDRFASTGTITFVSGAQKSVSAIVGDFTSIGCRRLLPAGFVIVDTKTAKVGFESYAFYLSVNTAISSW